jgi:transposase InsO family protein
MSKEVHEFAELYRIKLLHSSSYYAQTNGMAESSNRTLISLIKRRYLIILSIDIRFCLKL